MKKNFTLLLLLAFAFQAHSQNWMPVNATEKFFYKVDHSDFIKQSLYVDSISISGVDTVWHLNRVMIPCDSCNQNWGLIFSRLVNQQGILKKRLIKRQDGSVLLDGDERVVLLPLAETGQSWLYDTLNIITATVVTIDTATIFGQLDSIKTISLSGGGSIVLSKSFGLYQFRENMNALPYDLTGIEGRNLGDQVPGLFQIFDFQPGDVFQYQYYYDYTGWPDPVAYNEQFTVISSIVSPNGVEVVYSRIKGCFLGGLGWCLEPYSQDTVYESIPYYPGNKYDLYPGNKYDTTNACCAFPSHNQILEVGLASTVLTPAWGVNLHFDVKSYGAQSSEIYSDSSQGLYYQYYQDMWIPEDATSAYHEYYSAGIGLVARTNPFFEGIKLYELMGYVKNGDTTGIVSRPLIASTPAPTNSLPLKIYPNPASSILNIYLPQQVGIAGILQCTLTDMQGKAVRAWDMEKLSSVPVHDLPSGIYMLSVSQRGRVLGAEQVLIER